MLFSSELITFPGCIETMDRLNLFLQKNDFKERQPEISRRFIE